MRGDCHLCIFPSGNYFIELTTRCAKEKSIHTDHGINWNVKHVQDINK